MIGGGSDGPAPVAKEGTEIEYQKSADFQASPPDTEKKKTKDKISPAMICSILTVWAIIGLLVGIATHSVLILSLFMLPVVGYEIYRTKGESTTFASWALAVVIVLEIIFIAFGVSYDLGQYLNLDSIYAGGQYVPLGDIKILGPTLMAVLSLILLFRTAGPYTKWLSVIIIIVALVMVNMMNPEIFKELLRSGVQRIFWYF
ncbi:MAG: hypothetical protein WC080_02665 [Patescibacteria group bacterium]